MPGHIPISCPSCQRMLRVPIHYLGQRICCKHCNHAFEAEPGDVPAGIASNPGTAPAEPNGERAEQLRALRAELEQQQRARAALEHDLETVRAEAADQAQAARAAAEATRADFVHELDRLTEEIDGLRAERDRLAAGPETAQGDTAHALKEARSRWAAERQELQDQLDAAQRQFDQERDSLRGEVERLNRDLDQARRQGPAPAEPNDELAAQLGDLRAELERQQRARAALEHDLETARAEAAERERRLTDAVSSQQAAGERADRLEAEVQAARAELEALRRDAAAPPLDSRAGMAAPAAAQSQIEELTQQLQRAGHTIEQLRSLLDVLGITYPVT